MSLPQPLLKQLWDAGYGGKVIRVPPRNVRQQLKVVANEILKEAEQLYEANGTTYVLERRGRSDFYRSFGTLKLCRRFHLNIAEARKVRRRAYARWSHWFIENEERLLQLADRIGEKDTGKLNYLRIRAQLRSGNEVTGENRDLVESAQNSIRSVKWS